MSPGVPVPQAGHHSCKAKSTLSTSAFSSRPGVGRHPAFILLFLGFVVCLGALGADSWLGAQRSLLLGSGGGGSAATRRGWGPPHRGGQTEAGAQVGDAVGGGTARDPPALMEIMARGAM